MRRLILIDATFAHFAWILLNGEVETISHGLFLELSVGISTGLMGQNEMMSVKYLSWNNQYSPLFSDQMH